MVFSKFFAVLWIWIGSGFNGIPESGTRRGKMTHKNINRIVKKFHFLKCWVLSFVL
jgi:hypothetical protein